jgi:FkbM family methyltransferase
MQLRRVAAAREKAKVMLTRYPQAYGSLRRPYAAARFLLRRPHDPDYGVFALFPHREGVFLDVGANAGMSALSFRIYNRTMPVVSIEPNPFHETDLRFVGRLAKPLTYRMWAAGDEAGSMTLHVPVYRSVPLTTEASLLLEAVTGSHSLRARLGSRMDTPDFKVVSCDVPVRPLDSLHVDPAFIKLDVQGFEHQALLGLSETLDRAKPVLLVETPDDRVRNYLSAMNYQAFTYLPGEHRLVPETERQVNSVFVPPEDRPNGTRQR